MRLALLVVVSLLLVAAAQGEGAARAVKDDEISLSSFFSSIYGFFQSGFNSMFGSAKGSKNAKPVTDKKVNYRRWRLFKATPRSQDQLDEMQSIEEDFDRVQYWILPMERNQTVDFIVPPDMVGVMKDFLRERQINFQVVSKDLQKKIDAANPPMTQERSDALKDQVGHSMTWRRYHRYTDILRYMQYLEKTYPDMVSVVKLGKSTGGMPLKALKISTPAAKNAQPKPAIWIDGGTHAREWISPAVTTYIMKQLVENSKVNRMIVNTFDWYIQPVLNPDGYEYSHTKDRMWRKTRSQTESPKDDYEDSDEDEEDDVRRRRRRRALWPDFLFNSFCTKVGVDPNRNWDFHWGKEGASPSPCAETYAGPKAFSEPETKAVADFIMERKNQFKVFLTLHSYGQMWLTPWSFTDTKADDHDDLMRLGRKAVDAVAKIRGTKYKLGPTTEYLYKSAGSADDWAKGVAGIKYSYTVELPDKGYNGFLLPATEIIPVGKETFAGIKALAQEYMEVHLPKPDPIPALKRQPQPVAVSKRPQIKNASSINKVTTPPSVQKRTTVVQLRKSTPIPIRITTAKSLKNIIQNRRGGIVPVKNNP